MNNVEERAVIVIKELNRVIEYVRFNKLFNEKNHNFISSFLKKKEILEKEKEEKLTAGFLFYYTVLLGEYYSDSVTFLHDKPMKEQLSSAIKNLTEYNNSSLVDGIPDIFKEIISVNYTDEELKSLYQDSQENKTDFDFYIFLLGKQIGCINRTLCLDLDIEGKIYCAESLFLITQQTISMMELFSYNSPDYIRENIDDFYEKENLIIKNKKIDLNKKLKKVPSLVNGYYNYYDIIGRIKYENKKDH